MGFFYRAESSKNRAKCNHSVHQGQVWANSAELTYVIEALRVSGPMRLVESAGESARPSETRCSSLCGGRLVQSGERKVPGTYRAYRQGLRVSDFR